MVKNRVPNQLWVEAMNMSTYILNRCPTKSNNMIIPKEFFSSIKFDVHHLRLDLTFMFTSLKKEG
jgi:hypothetical protein